MNLLRSWTVIRWIKLGSAVLFLAAGVAGNDALAYTMAAFLGLQALLGMGCPAGGCTPRKSVKSQEEGTISYEEIR